VQLTLLAGTALSVVGLLKVQLIVSTTLPPCSIVIVALVKATSVIASVQLEPGQLKSGEVDGIGEAGALVVIGPND
jgi:hypothetical protein